MKVEHWKCGSSQKIFIDGKLMEKLTDLKISQEGREQTKINLEIVPDEYECKHVSQEQFDSKKSTGEINLKIKVDVDTSMLNVLLKDIEYSQMRPEDFVFREDGCIYGRVFADMTRRFIERECLPGGVFFKMKHQQG